MHSLMDCCLAKEKKSGADLRRVIIQIYLLLKDLDCSSKVLLLLQTIIKIGEISYSLDDRRSPRQLLQRKLTRSKMFGHYLHALTAHSPTQYELTSLRTLNTENQERKGNSGVLHKSPPRKCNTASDVTPSGKTGAAYGYDISGEGCYTSISCGQGLT